MVEGKQDDQDKDGQFDQKRASTALRTKRSIMNLW